MEKESKFISLVVYLHDNEKEIDEFLNTVVNAIDQKFSKYELVCVDDQASEELKDKVVSFIKDNHINAMVNMVHMSYYQGLEASMNAGRDLAIGDFVFEFDTTFVDYDPSVISECYESLLKGFDIVAARSKGKQRFFSKMFYRIYNTYSKSGNNKLANDSLRILSRRAINRAKSMGTSIPYRKAVYANSGLKMGTVMYEPKKGVRGQRKSTGHMSLALDSFVYFTTFLEKISAVLSCVFLLATLGIVAYILADVFMHHNTADGWLSIMGFLSLGFLGIFVLLSIVMRYLSTLINVVFRQQNYLISDIEKIVSGDSKND